MSSAFGEPPKDYIYRELRYRSLGDTAPGFLPDPRRKAHHRVERRGLPLKT